MPEININSTVTTRMIAVAWAQALMAAAWRTWFEIGKTDG